MRAQPPLAKSSSTTRRVQYSGAPMDWIREYGEEGTERDNWSG